MARTDKARFTTAAHFAGVVLLAVGTIACERQEPRSFNVFMDDAIARDGALARCNQDRDASLRDVECANARRAAAALTVLSERARMAELELESERKLLELRRRVARDAEATRLAEEAAVAEAEAAYEALWQKKDEAPAATTADVPDPLLLQLAEAGVNIEANAEAEEPLDGPTALIAGIEAAPPPGVQPETSPTPPAAIPRPFRPATESAP